MIVLGLDFETNSLDAATAEITEVGAVLWDTVGKVPVSVYDYLVRTSVPQPEEVVEVTGITDEYLRKYGVDEHSAAHILLGMMKQVEVQAVVAHNGNEFDFPILRRVFAKYEIEMPKLAFVDTIIDVPYPAHVTSRKLKHLAVDHEVPVMFAHRAVFDVIMMLQIMNKYDVDNIVLDCAAPVIEAVAIVDFDHKELAKAAGFRWDGVRKLWIKNMRANVLEREKDGYKFRVVTNPKE